MSDKNQCVDGIDLVVKDDKTSRLLGLTQSVIRRDFLNPTLLALGAALLNTLTPLQLLAQNGGWGGYTGEGDYRDANGDTLEVMQAGHSVRDGAFDKALTAASQGRDVSPARCDELRAVLIVTAGQNVLDKLHEFAYIASTAYCPGHEEAVRGTAQTAIDAGNDLLRSVCLTAHRLG